MSSAQTTPANESVPADTATSVPATEGNLPVAQYHLLQLQKRAQDSADTPSAVLYGSSALNTDGSIPIDFGSDIEDVPVEEDEAALGSGPRTPSPFPKRPPSGHSAVPMALALCLTVLPPCNRSCAS
ncbi:hypothetical protein PPTG_06207 [Phytophthora nicotianae INRA-310]|uniref:Uncharacterized protein n=1 Tax=Phytophthora nicotianae (strain INRA-310) TaxID=761204 RepID=W2QSM2_PHYN3|nr:hypothetical protein PPTG_06207 [Phytophthora nicotianae INRA-310]ETN15946.1 hypothetical protein PPTG_06207 [Phytophthora nicotianae INRA-310]